MKRHKVCIVIPAYNEEVMIFEVVTDVSKILTGANIVYDIVVVNDGSKDQTKKESLRAGAIVIDHILNSGAGAATATGLSFAEQNGYTVAVTMDADGQHSAEDVLAGIKKMMKSDYDLLVGSRLIDKNGMPRVKIIGNQGLSLITFILFGINITDSQSGLRVFSRKSLELLKWKTSGYEFCSEMLWRAKQQGLLIGEYPIMAIYTDYSISKGQNNWNAFNIVSSLFKRRLVELINE